MNQPNPDWYGALQNNPLKEETFTDQLAVRITTNAISSTRKTVSVPRRLSFIGLAMACVLGLILFVNERESIQPPTVATSSTLANSEWQQLVNQQSPDSHVLYVQNYSDKSTLVFSEKITKVTGKPVIARRNDPPDAQIVTLRIDNFEQTMQPWKPWEWAGAVGASFRRDKEGVFYEQAEDELITAFSALETTGLFHGIVVDPVISDVRVTDGQGMQHSAAIIPSQEGYTYWFAPLPFHRDHRDEYTVQGLDSHGNVITSKSFNYH
ncbi:hypothetical protein PCCS19_07630 [Paenibacillus sp. CCS19]|uniref:hypothetical protein n=1 Tax=Paenibacillus sp. CCS19 TaxID=3158387 RepID=UPI002564A236|nr:hypothetical protein [Paenibacillus cellulosilyticus]GMK37709.1 hypothetical protein PCCS19_07630 [Paenibacillus cellulosilyticus]